MVEPLVGSDAAIASSAIPVSAVSGICIRLSRRTGALPPLTKRVRSSRSDWLRSTRYPLFIPKVLTCGSALGESAITQILGRNAPATAPRFTAKQGQYLAFRHAYLQINRRAPAEADFQRDFPVTAPSVHSMSKTLDQSGLIGRQPSVARSIKLLVPPQELPLLGVD